MFKKWLKKIGFSSYPKGLDLYLTYNCNLNCTYCPWIKRRKKDNLKDIYMKKENAFKLIEDIKKFKPFIRLFGGEPFLHPDWCEIVRYGIERGINFTCVTNGTLLLSQAEKIVSSGIYAVGISLDGFSNDLRGKNTQEKIIEGIKEINKIKKINKKDIPVIEIYLTINAENYETLFDFGKYLESLNIKLYRLQHLIWFTKEQYDSSIQILKENFKDFSLFGVEESYIRKEPYNIDPKKLKEQIKKIKNNKFPFEVDFHPDLDQEEIENYYYDLNYQRSFPCKTMEWYCFISPEGILFPCITIDMGNVFKEKFSRLWNSKKARKFRKIIRKLGRLPFCSRCPD